MKRILFVGVLLLLGRGTCTADAYALAGIVVTPDQVLPRGFVVVRNGMIEAVQATPPAGLTTIESGGIVLPGMIDLHNHVTWNFQPRWQPPQVFRDRFDWQATPEYLSTISKVQYEIRKTLACDQERYGEIKALVNGATSTNGSLASANECAEGLARNLDVASGLNGPGVNKEPVVYMVFPFEFEPARENDVRKGLSSESLFAFFHLAEGTDGSARRELQMLDKQELLKEGVTLIHGTALRAPDDFKLLADRKVALVWSPRSNEELYGRTTDVAGARAANVMIAIAPDWSITGSEGMLDELRYAYFWNEMHGAGFTPLELLRMATAIPAKLAGAAGRIGEISAGQRADVIVIEKTRADIYESILTARASQIRLVTVNGRPLVGLPNLVRQIAPGGKFEDFDLCGTTRSIDLSDADGGKGASLAATRMRLEDALAPYKQHVSPLAACP